MAGGGAPSAWGPSPALVTALVALLGLGLAAYIVGPQLYWHAAEVLTAAAACPACDCNCDARPLLDLPEDCAKHFKGVKSRASGEETEKSFTELLVEELKQREEEATQAQQEADVKLLEAKKLASQYQKEADKCSSGMDTCEETRENSAEALVQQKKLTSLWERRARELGWRPENAKARLK
ncbi:uncharacterized protein LOC100276901 [Zea mays]|uniref:Uncharacterized protein n=1 Tax=Zea mays TaxID=4577 RepID=B6TKV9_MAIZE|nr:uncharacterized protein LOC100276901 [Zea mays]ACG37742.1 hypothetical protein [Zea mays]ONM09918.1 hypothetical protein ZEAMMB73_Zm00001d034279 [Zea mays]|eukprot:NP_001144072.1 uncharacterized protein LOC100276901 [Zea mays]